MVASALFSSKLWIVLRPNIEYYLNADIYQILAQLNVITPRTAFSTKLVKLADYQAASINVQIYINNVLYTITHSVLHASLHTKASWSSHELEESVFKVSFDEESVYARYIHAQFSTEQPSSPRSIQLHAFSTQHQLHAPSYIISKSMYIISTLSLWQIAVSMQYCRHDGNKPNDEADYVGSIQLVDANL